jgi:chemotaxis protein CheD
MAVSAISSIFPQHVIVGVGDLAVSNDSGTVLSTYALGSCIGLVAYEPRLRAGGILHLMLPDSSISPEKAANNPAMFADTGLAQFFRQLLGFRMAAASLRLFMAGGASVIMGADPFKIGERNTRATLDILARNGLSVMRSDVGGSVNRTLHLDLATGIVKVRTPSGEAQVCLAV